MSDDSTLTVPAARIQQLIDVLSLISLDEYAPALALLDGVEGDDRMSFLEQSLGIFVEELVAAKEDNESHIAELEQSKRELEQSKRELEARLETIERQRDAIRALSTPVIELWDEIITLPVVGLVDTQRSLEMTEALLERIHERGYRCVLIDVTGVDVIDTMTANHFLTMIRSAQLLGAYCVVTGMSPSIAQMIASLGLDMDELPTLRSLKEGLRHCLHHLAASKTDGRS